MWPENAEGLFLTAMCLLALSDYNNAYAYFQKTLVSEPNHQEAKKYMIYVNSELRSSLLFKLIRKPMDKELREAFLRAEKEKKRLKLLRVNPESVPLTFNRIVITAVMAVFLLSTSTHIIDNLLEDKNPLVNAGVNMSSYNSAKISRVDGIVQDVKRLDLLCIRRIEPDGRTKTVFLNSVTGDGQNTVATDGWLYIGNNDGKKIVFTHEMLFDKDQTIVLGFSGTSYEMDEEMANTIRDVCSKKSIHIDKLDLSQYVVFDSNKY